jgi:hypothetical protein
MIFMGVVDQIYSRAAGAVFVNEDYHTRGGKLLMERFGRNHRANAAKFLSAPVTPAPS